MLFWLIAIGALIGLLSSFFGIGGGIIIGPTLYWFFPGLPPLLVIGTSLATICLNSTLNVIHYFRARQRPCATLSLVMGSGMAIGNITGGCFIDALASTTPQAPIVFLASFLFLAAILNSFKKVQRREKHHGDTHKAKAFFFALLGGLVSGSTGLGGGIVLVPLMIAVLHMPLRWIAVYANVCMAMGTFFGVLSYTFRPLLLPPPPPFSESFLGHFQVGCINWGIVFLFALGALTTSKMGMRLHKRPPESVIRFAFSSFLLISALRLFMMVL